MQRTSGATRDAPPNPSIMGWCKCGFSSFFNACDTRVCERMSAHSSQSYHTPKEEKDAYIEGVIELLEFQPLADDIVISSNVEAQKRLTIGIELVSSSEHWLFLDKPASGLNGGSALIRDWNYCLGFLLMDIHRKNLMPQRRERGDHRMHCSTAPDFTNLQNTILRDSSSHPFTIYRRGDHQCMLVPSFSMAALLELCRADLIPSESFSSPLFAVTSQ